MAASPIKKTKNVRKNKGFREKWADRVRQFGVVSSTLQGVRAAIRPIWSYNSQQVLAIPHHRPQSFSDPAIREISKADTEYLALQGDLTERQLRSVDGFLANGCRCFLAEVEGSLGGYAFIQPSGTYVFWGGTGRLVVPKGMTILKNLLVFTDFRGCSLGKKLNQVRIASIPESDIPIVFVLSENRYAIRNLKMYGFEEILGVTRTTWFRTWVVQRTRVTKDGEIARRLIDGMNRARGG